MNAVAPASPAPLVLRRGIDLSALGALFVITLRSLCRARRLIVLSLLFAMPVAIACLARVYPPQGRPLGMDPFTPIEIGLMIAMLPHALIPLTALLFASGMIQDELEEQTLTYLLVRPLPRWSIYVTKLLATILVTAVLAGVFTTATFLTIWWGQPEHPVSEIFERLGKFLTMYILILAAYCSVFGCLSLLVRRTLILGVAYIVLLEGVAANIPFVIHEWTIMYYFRMLALRWFNYDFLARDWQIDLTTAATASEAMWTLLGASLGATLVAVYWFTTREFRVKTPEGS